jgi:hypothetical protein
MKFYVYVYRDPRPRKGMQPIYVGKGTGDRDVSHWLRGSHNKPLQDFMSHVRLAGLAPPCQRVFETDVESEAFTKEIELIALYGRRSNKTGTLFNLTDGGEGGSGTVRTAAHKEADSLHTLKHWQDPEYRAKVVAAQQAAQSTPEARAIKAENSTHAWTNPETRQKRQTGIKAARNTESSKAKTSEQAKAQWADPEYAAKQTANNREIASRPEVKAAKSAASKARWADPIWKAKMLAARKKKVDPTQPL